MFDIADQTFWLSATNIGLALLVLVCAAAVAISVVRAVVARIRKRSALPDLDREVKDLVAKYEASNLHGRVSNGADHSEC